MNKKKSFKKSAKKSDNIFNINFCKRYFDDFNEYIISFFNNRNRQY